MSDSAYADWQHRNGLDAGIGRRRPDDDKPRLGRNRLGDDRYCAPCGILFWQIVDAAAHRRAEHPEQARFEAMAGTALTEGKP